MGEYTVSEIEEELTEEAGELMVVLESDREYELHIHDTQFDEDGGTVTTEGMIDGEYRVVTFPAASVEHTYIHREN